MWLNRCYAAVIAVSGDKALCHTDAVGCADDCPGGILGSTDCMHKQMGVEGRWLWLESFREVIVVVSAICLLGSRQIDWH